MKQKRRVVRTQRKEHYSKNMKKTNKKRITNTIRGITKTNKHTNSHKTPTKKICGGGDGSSTKLQYILVGVKDVYDKEPDNKDQLIDLTYLINIIHTNPNNMKNVDQLFYLLKEHSKKNITPTDIKEYIIKQPSNTTPIPNITYTQFTDIINYFHNKATNIKNNIASVSKSTINGATSLINKLSNKNKTVNLNNNIDTQNINTITSPLHSPS